MWCWLKTVHTFNAQRPITCHRNLVHLPLGTSSLCQTYSGKNQRKRTPVTPLPCEEKARENAKAFWVWVPLE